MGLVSDLQLEALSKDADIMSLLRRAHFVARKLNLTEFDKWINSELNGYGANEDVPKYRLYHGDVQAYNPYRGWIPVLFDSETRWSLHEAREPIAHLVDLYNKSENFIFVEFNDSINTYLSKYCSPPTKTKYRLQISTHNLYSTFESIKTSILDWSITLEESGIVGEGLQFTDSEMRKASETPAIYQFTNNFYGNVKDTQVQQGTMSSTQEQSSCE